MDDLKQFKKAYEQLQKVRKEFTPYKNNWYAWNYWAQHQSNFSFSDWMQTNNLKFEDVAGTKQNYTEVDILRDKEEGYRYYSAWKGAQCAVENAELFFDHLFEMLWKETNLEGKPKYSNDELGEQIGKSGDQLRKFAAQKKWYIPRKRKAKK